MKRVITVKGSNKEIMEICDEISKMNIDCAIETKKASYSEDIDASENIIRIKIYGYDRNKMVENHKDILNLINRIHKKYSADSRGFYEYRLSDLKVPINKELIIDTFEALKINFKYIKDENLIKCPVEIEELNKILEELHAISLELNFMNIGSKPVKNVIALASYITGRAVEDIIDECLEKEFFREEDERIVLNKDINLVKKHLLEGNDE